jgi:hypothetical protein
VSTTTTPPGDVDLATIEERADERLAEGGLDAPIPDGAAEEPIEPDTPVLRLGLAVGATTIAAAIMAGGIFTGFSPRIYAAVAGILGIALGGFASRLRRAIVTNLAIAVGLFAIGLFTLALTGPGNIANASRLVSEAAKAGDVLRPPVKFEPGWAAILGWLLGAVGFGAMWTAVTLQRRSLALLVPVPIIGIAAISVPKDQQLASGLVALVLFAIGLGLLSAAQTLGEDDQRPPLSYELRRAVRAIPLIAAVTFALYLAAQSNFLFPKPLIDPTQQPQKPRTVPLSEVKDRPLFEVSDTTVNGPWRIGSLDVYDGKDWRLPPFSDNRLNAVPRSGVVDEQLPPGNKATFTIKQLSGAVLPSLPNTVGIVAKGPRLAFDTRNGNIRVDQGQIEPGLSYTVTAAAFPSTDALESVSAEPPKAIRAFLQMPAPPPAVQDLLGQAKSQAPSKWGQVDFLRRHVLETVTAAGAGSPVSVPPLRVQDMLTGSKEGSPFEIVAAQAMLARWAGVPARIGYGFDKGKEVDGHVEVRPRNGATFLEVYFSGYGWVPVSGEPLRAKPTVGNSGQRQTSTNVQPSEDIAVQLYLPIVLPLRGVLAEQVRRVIAIVLPILLALALLYLVWPAVKKAIARSRRRTRAQERGLAARIANSYAEWRDFATDFGYRHGSDTPLMFLSRFPDDDEHAELAWLVTRALFGDLQEELTIDHAVAAEELSRAMRRRLGQAHPATVRMIAALSRLSLRHPYAPGLAVPTRRERRRHAVAAPAPA